MSQPYPKEFRDDVVRVALNRDEKTTIAQIAKDFGGHEGTTAKWLRQKQTSMPESSPAKTRHLLLAPILENESGPREESPALREFATL